MRGDGVRHTRQPPHAQGSPCLCQELPWGSSLCRLPLEPAVWEPAAEVQEQQRVAEAVGGVHQLLPVLLQVPPGECPHSTLPVLGHAGLRASHVCRSALWALTSSCSKTRFLTSCCPETVR